ncbi:unnamed protein product [Calicophoron daubneyi]|uniref:WD repeat domain phosphoinositide-interacting protein 2 n=1 Tax=Calicophoron daubneyi TaxID=300641 RepID=A0AAV2U075_CALDB
MNVACNRHDDNLPILFVDFNQDYTSIQVGTKSGYSLLSTVGDQIVETFSTTGDPVCIVGRLFNRSLVVSVSQNDMRKLLVSHSRINTLICHYRYTLTILAVKMNHQRLVVCVEDGIFIHNIRDMQMLHKIEETPPNRNGVLALSACEENCYLAYPGSHRVGTVFIFDAISFQNVTSIAAHDGLLAALAFNANATLLATASEKGTVIRVFSIPQGDKVAEFRRGLTRCVSICCLTFSMNNQYLVAASHTETVHVFKLESHSSNKNSDNPHLLQYSRQRTSSSGSAASQNCSVDDPESVTSEDTHSIGGGAAVRGSPLSSGLQDGSGSSSGSIVGSWSSGIVGWMGSTLKAYSSYLPHQVSEIISQDRSFAYAHLPTGPASSFWPTSGSASSAGDASSPLPPSSQPVGLHKVAAVIYYQNQPRLIVAGLDGLVHTFAIDQINGGEAALLRTQRLLSPNPTGSCPRPLAQPPSPASRADSSSEKPSAGPHLSSGPQQPGVYVAPRSSVSSRATTFAAAVAGGITEEEEGTANHSSSASNFPSPDDQ